MSDRCAFGAYSASKWVRLIYTDEHDIIHPVGKSGSRQIHSRKRSVWKKADGSERHHNDCVRPKPGKNCQGGKHFKVCAAICNGRMLAVEPVKKLIEKRDAKPLVVKPQAMSKNGKAIGRPRTAKKKAKKFDGLAYAEFIPTLAKAAREELGVGPEVALVSIYDNASWHWTAEVRKAMAESNVHFLEDYPARSPSCNPIENIFGIAENAFMRMHVKRRPKSEEETLQRFNGACDEAQSKGHIKKTMASMPKRLEVLIEADGGPIKP